MLFFQIFLCITLLSFLLIAYRLISALEAKNRIEENKLIKDTVIDDTITDQLDSIIKECLEEYLILNPNLAKADYITTKTEKNIIDYVSENTSNRISPLLIKKLEYKYSKDYIPDIIGSRVYLAVVDYILSVNLGASDKK